MSASKELAELHEMLGRILARGCVWDPGERESMRAWLDAHPWRPPADPWSLLERLVGAFRVVRVEDGVDWESGPINPDLWLEVLAALAARKGGAPKVATADQVQAAADAAVEEACKAQRRALREAIVAQAEKNTLSMSVRWAEVLDAFDAVDGGLPR